LFDPHIFPSFIFDFWPPTMVLPLPQQQEQQHQQEQQQHQQQEQQEQQEQQQLAEQEKNVEEETTSCAFLPDDLERIVATSLSSSSTSAVAARQMAALRLRHDGALADRLVRLWLAQQQQEYQQQHQRTALLGSDNDHDDEPMLMNEDDADGRLVRRRSSSRTLVILDHIIRCDPTLAEEIVCHSLFRTLLNGHTTTNPKSSNNREENGSDPADNDDEDEDQELVYSIMAFQKQFPNCCFTRSELQQRLPISLSFVGGGSSRSSTAAAAARDDVRTTMISVLIQQVTQRQSAQSDVGFGTCYRGGFGPILLSALSVWVSHTISTHLYMTHNLSVVAVGSGAGPLPGGTTMCGAWRYPIVT
jgi:hypothetical protein